MATTNFDLAPASKTVDELLAVPIDIQHINATLTFDGATHTGSGDATLAFTMGPDDGNPIFDLRQTITGVWLDGGSVPVADVAHHDLGGGPNAELCVVERVLAAGSTHTLRVTYTLGTPQAPGAGSYQPAMTWSNGPRLAFNFGFTDLGPGRYLEAWIPANLIFDQFQLTLELALLNTGVSHTVITNGQVTALGGNHWRLTFPARFTALSPLLELRATDTLASATGTANLPVSGASVNIEAWKLTTGSADLTTQVNNIRDFLTANESSTGPYMHGNRFVAFIHVGGMEYEGGTTTSATALQHETFHSWWARGVKPASQADAWFDEAWTVYNDNGASTSLPFNFADPMVTLCNRNPWSRATAAGAYTDGYRFWRGIAALVGVSALNTTMSDFYKRYRSRPVRTTDIEELLICQTGNPQIVDAFHRFVYGFTNPGSMPDLWLRDDPGHTGPDLWSGRFWDSPDVWVRNADDGGTTHQPPEFGQDNWFYARVRNRGPVMVRHFVVTFAVKAFAGTQFVYPGDFLPCTAAASGFDLAAGSSAILKACWPRHLIPQPGSHSCLLAAVLTRSDQPVAGRHVWEYNNLAQRNIAIVDLAPNQMFVLPFVVSNLLSRVSKVFRMELVRPAGLPHLRVSLLHTQATLFRPVAARTTDTAEAMIELDCGGAVTGEGRMHDTGDRELRPFPYRFEARFPEGPTADIPVRLGPQEQSSFFLRLTMPPDARPGDTVRLDLLQRNTRDRMILGGVAVGIRVK